MDSYTIDDEGGRKIRFRGTLLASTSTREKDSIRWSETNLWKTRAGKYLLQKVGRTLVYHAVGGCKYGEVRELRELKSQIDKLVPCPVCQPLTLDNTMYGPSHQVKVETDRFSVHVSDTADGIVESGKLQDDDGVWYTPRVVRDAFEHAARDDDELFTAYMTTVVE